MTFIVTRKDGVYISINIFQKNNIKYDRQKCTTRTKG